LATACVHMLPGPGRPLFCLPGLWCCWTQAIKWSSCYTTTTTTQILPRREKY